MIYTKHWSVGQFRVGLPLKVPPIGCVHVALPFGVGWFTEVHRPERRRYALYIC